jgi:hypothetical protein
MGILGAALVVLAILGGAGLMVWRAWKGQKAREQRLLDLGFTRLPGLPGFQERLEAIYRRSARQVFKMGSIYEKREQQGHFYIFDLVETSGEDNTWIANGSAAYISPALNLPRVHISARIPAGKGAAGAWMAGMAERLIDWAVSRAGMTRLELLDYPEVDEKLMILAVDEAAALEFFNRKRLDSLLWLADPQRMSEIDCAGDCFVLKRGPARQRAGAETELRLLLEDAGWALDALR